MMATDQYAQRFERLNAMRRSEKCDLLLIEEPTTLYYLTGLDLSAGRILLSDLGAELLVDARYIEMSQAHSPIPALLDSPDQTAEKLKGFKHIGFDQNETSFGRVQQLAEQSGAKMHPIERLHQGLRMVKDAREIEVLSEAAALGSRGYDYAVSLLKEGVTERQVAIELEIFWLREGGQGLAFEPIIAFGANSSMPHYHSGDVALQRGDMVLLDMGCIHKHYNSDMTRTLFFGEPDPKMRKVYETVRVAQQAAVDACRPGIRCKDLDAVARQRIEEAGFGAEFSHSLGHGIGLEVHEQPGLRARGPDGDIILEEGMVITIEPGIYLAGIGGVRIEDSVVVTADGCQDLTQRSKELQVISTKH